MGWSGWAEVPGGGVTKHAPALGVAAAGSSGGWALQVYVIGTDGGMHRKRFRAGIFSDEWGGWKPLQVASPLACGPGVSEHNLIAVTERSGSVSLRTDPGRDIWTNLGGHTNFEPWVTTSFGANYVFITEANGRVIFKRDSPQYSSDHWLKWYALPGDGVSIDRPAAAHYEPGGIPLIPIPKQPSLHVVVRGTDNGIHHAYRKGGKWHLWGRVPGGSTVDGPALESYDGDLHLVVRGSDDALHHNIFDGSEWGGWSRIGGRTFSAPALREYDGDLYLVVRGTDDRVHYATYS